MLRKTLTILSLIGLLLSAGLWGVSYLNVAVYRVALPWHLCVWATRGSLDITDSKFSQDDITSLGLSNGYAWECGSLRTLTVGWHWGPRYSSDKQMFSLYIPLYLPVLLFGVWPAWLLLPFHRRRKRKKLGLCLKCGYDLRASKDRCPECGTQFGSSRV